MPISFSLKPAVFKDINVLRIVAIVSQPAYKENPILIAKKLSVVTLDYKAIFIISTAVMVIPIMMKLEIMNPANVFYWKVNNQNGVMAKFTLGTYPSLLKMRSLLRLGAAESGRAW